jgi:transcriptional regulator with XRE-family HTH domain
LNEFPERLRKLREERKPIKSMAVVSELCGLPRGAVRKYERGEAKPNMSALIALADYYEVSLDYLTGRAKYR